MKRILSEICNVVFDQFFEALQKKYITIIIVPFEGGTNKCEFLHFAECQFE